MSAVSALQKFRVQLIYFLANQNVNYEDIEVDGYRFTLSKRTDPWFCDLVGVPHTPFVMLSCMSARTWGVEDDAYRIFYDLCKLRFKLCVVFQTWISEHEGWTLAKTDGLCYLYRFSDEVQE